jgi:CHAT domain-containing protein/Flp pilus assembly protein TadD
MIVGLCLSLSTFGGATFAQQSLDPLEKRHAEAFDEGRRLYFQGDFEAAKQRFHESSELYQRIKGLPHPLSLKYEALCYQYQDDLDKALTLFQEALRVDKEIGGSKAISDSLNNVGWVFYLKGDYSEAIKYLKEAEPTAHEPDPGDIQWNKGRVLANLGAAYIAIGNYSMALKCLRYVLDQGKLYNDTMNQTRTLQHLGNLERSWGNHSNALKYYEEAIRVARQSYTQPYNRAYLVDALNDLGALYAQVKRFARARASFQEALAVSRELGTRRLIAQCLNNLGSLFREQGNLSEALNQHQEALRLSQETELVPMMALALGELGLDSMKSEEYSDAIAYFNQALEVGGRGLTAELKARVYLGLAESHEKLGEWQKALDYYHRAIESIEQVRLEALSEDRKLGYWQTKQATFERAISLVHRLYQKTPQSSYGYQAFAYAEQARARAFLDMLAEARVYVRQGLSPDVQQEERAIFQEMTRINKALLHERLSRNERVKLEEDFAETEERLQEFRQQLRLNHPAYAELLHSQPIDLEKVRKDLLGENTLLVEFLLGDEKSFMWSVSRKQFHMVMLPSRSLIESYVKRFRKAITSASINVESINRCHRLAFQIYNLLLKPIEKALAQHKRLVIIPDGILYYLPFEALVVRGATTVRPSFLLSTHSINYAPSASVLAQLITSKEMGDNKLELLAYGDPVFSRRQLRNASNRSDNAPTSTVRDFYQQRGINLEPLPHTRREVKGIVAQYPLAFRKAALGIKAAESGFKREPLDRYRRLHLATHGLIDERAPARSGIVFSFVGEQEEDGVLQMNEIFNLRLDSDLVVLSACRTGMGKIVRGEGIAGLTRAFLYAGSRSVVVSLWNVQDLSTAEFMKTFHKYLRAGKSKVEALRMAKLDTLHSDIPAYRHPYYWAAFVLVGRE